MMVRACQSCRSVGDAERVAESVAMLVVLVEGAHQDQAREVEDPCHPCHPSYPYHLAEEHLEEIRQDLARESTTVLEMVGTLRRAISTIIL